MDYYKYLNIFNKIESNTLPNYYPYDYKINFEEGYRLEEFSYSPLYKMSLDELEAVYKYILENLLKGFIEINLLLWAAPILFVKKINNNLRFYINY